MKRFYRSAAVRTVAGGSGIALDERPVRTPGGHELVVASPDLAEAIAAEWAAQADTIQPDAMPLTRFATTATDLMPARRADVVAETAGFGATDLLSHRAAEPADLVLRQLAAWQPIVDWAAARYDAPVAVVTGVTPARHPPAALDRLHDAVEAYADWPLLGLHAATTTLGSLLLALAMAEGRLDPKAAFEASVLDETFEIERWGEDPSAMARRARAADEVRAAARFVALTR
jgi:chaperone required for assembly of F1-ATPase